MNSLTLESVALRSSEQFEFLRAEIAPMSGMLVERREPTRSPFEFRVQRYSAPSIALESAAVGNPLQVRVTKKSMATAMSDRLSLHYRTAGTDRAVIFGHNTSVAGPQDLRIIDFQQPFYSDLSRFQSLNLVLNRTDVLGELPLIHDQSGDIIHNNSLTNTLRQLILCIFQELKSATDAEAARMLSHLRQFTIDTLRFHMLRDLESSEIPNQSKLSVVLSYIERHYNEQGLTPENLAAATSMSRATLYRLCRTMGSPRDLIQKTRLRKAAEHIRSGEGTNIEALSHSVGFTGRQSFTRAFRREFELSPKEYRQAYSPCSKNTPDQGSSPCRWKKMRRSSLDRVDNRTLRWGLAMKRADVCSGGKLGTKTGVEAGMGIL
ncbi:helix-turn-helix domain-containing protein [Yoonia sp. R2-816]|uniref:helix-turn-helix domain-containing protein n=1 Tax=Yoonia sp. R2-816 TaxID=3342638 RepID=UPI00372CF360